MFAEAQLRQLEEFLRESRTRRLRDVAVGDFALSDIAVRHDVDDDLQRALAFARWEHERGFVSSYFLLPTAEYWKKRAATIDVAVQIEQLGHEVGLHNDVYHYDPDPDRALQTIAHQCSEMRNWGIDVVGCADHGSGEPFNVDLWREHGRRPWEIGLLYEAYELQRAIGVTYISDSGARWSSPLERAEGKLTVVLVHPQHWSIYVR